MTESKAWCVEDADTGHSLAVVASESAARQYAHTLGCDERYIVRRCVVGSELARLLGIRHDVAV